MSYTRCVHAVPTRPLCIQHQRPKGKPQGKAYKKKPWLDWSCLGQQQPSADLQEITTSIQGPPGNTSSHPENSIGPGACYQKVPSFLGTRGEVTKSPCPPMGPSQARACTRCCTRLPRPHQRQCHPLLAPMALPELRPQLCLSFGSRPQPALLRCIRSGAHHLRALWGRSAWATKFLLPLQHRHISGPPLPPRSSRPHHQMNSVPCLSINKAPSDGAFSFDPRSQPLLNFFLRCALPTCFLRAQLISIVTAWPLGGSAYFCAHNN